MNLIRKCNFMPFWKFMRKGIGNFNGETNRFVKSGIGREKSIRKAWFTVFKNQIPKLFLKAKDGSKSAIDAHSLANRTLIRCDFRIKQSSEKWRIDAAWWYLHRVEAVSTEKFKKKLWKSKNGREISEARSIFHNELREKECREARDAKVADKCFFLVHRTI